MQSNQEKLARHDDILVPVLDELKSVLIKVFNQNEDVSELTKVINKLDAVRHYVNNIEDIGFTVGINEWLIVTFPLSGNPSKDAGQINLTPPKEKMN